MGTTRSVPTMGIPVPGIPASPPPGTTYQDFQPTATVPWSTDICGCFPDHFGRFCVSFWCPCYTFGQIFEMVDRRSTSCGVNGAIYFLLAWVTGCACCYSMVYRMKMRKQFALKGDGCEDCIFHCLCEACETGVSRWYDVSLGWTGNEGRQDRGVAMALVIEPG